MRRLLPVFFLSLLLAVSLPAQDNANRNSFSAKVLFVDYGRANGIDGLGLTNGLELAYIRNLAPWLNVAVPLKVGVMNVEEDINNRTFASIDGVLQLQYPTADTAFLTPYLMGGAGLNWETDAESHVQIPVGAGLNIRVGGRSYVNLQGEYRIAQEDNRNNVQIGLGYLHRFGKIDADGDGVADALDKCPDIPGSPETEGCPDQDMDGIANAEDDCPAVAGPKRFGGCPDTDKDGIADPKDLCPEEAGLAELNGCPDSDGDGVADRLDECPDEAGTLQTKGCLDTDGDGIPDKEDDCPVTAGTAEFNGCPFSDRDSDKVADEEDECPDTPGNFELDGCPDSDNDGVADKDDACPEVAGEFDGCPDTDGDGLNDAEDACPDRAGTAENKGCPELNKEEKEVLDFAMRAVQFETGKARLKDESEEVLDQIAEIMERYAGYQLKISGHTDSVGDEEDNKILSEERAEACYQYLVSKGISPDRISYEGFGEERPIASNSRSAGRRLNRRVEFDLYIDNE